MSKITRSTQIIFGSTGNVGTGGFGAAADGNTATEVSTSNTLAVLMGTTAWPQGWIAATLGASKFPAVEDMNAVEYSITTQLAYLFQQGIPEYDAGTTYFIGGVCMGVGTTQLFKSLTNNNLGNALPTPPNSNSNWQYCGDFSANRVVLNAAASYYVATTGSNSNPGTLASPWLTIQYAFDYISKFVDLGGQTVTINVADGTYTGNINLVAPFTGSGVVILKGNLVTPANCIISNASTDCIILANGAQLEIEGFKLVSAGGSGINVGPDATCVIIGNMNFGAVNANHLAALWGGQINILSGGSYTISGGGQFHLLASNNGVIQDENNSVTLTGTPAFSSAFAQAKGNATITIYNTTFSGSATGPRYATALNGVIDTNGGGASYLPGNSAGSSATGGQYG